MAQHRWSEAGSRPLARRLWTANAEQRGALQLAHFGVLGRRFVVVAEQVEDAVNGEQRQLVGQLDAALTSASRRAVGGEGDTLDRCRIVS